MLTLDRVYTASRVLKEVCRETDMILAPNLRKDANIYLKTENLQVTGSFKVRGAYFKISRLSEEEKARGVIACSAGNHAQGVALAAARSGIKSVICLPDGAPISKVEATKRFGAEVCMVKGVYDDAYNKAIELRDEHGTVSFTRLMILTLSLGRAPSGLRLWRSCRMLTWLSCQSAAAD
jgi:threonine dehydratase